jgi:poly-gamma-glutamate synthesis protein (capsule biosynthesis protein)
VVEVLAVGDVMTGRSLARTPGLFLHVSDALRAADLAIGNLEGVVTSTPPAGNSQILHLPVDTPATLAEAGFDLLGLANNHSLDAGPEGLAETARRLEAAGIEPLASRRAAVRKVDGLEFAFLAWNDLEPAGADELLLQAVGDARKRADFVIVLVHWGQEYVRRPVPPQRDLASELLQAGADLVLGSHPHVVQAVQILRGPGDDDRPRLVAYSLGNFAFDQGVDDTAQGLALRLLFDDDGLRAAQALPLWTAPRPHWMDPADSAALIERIVTPARIGFACSAQGCRRADVPDDLRSGRFWSGAIDLTGDGVHEMIRRVGEKVEIIQGGKTVWRSPPEWRIRDLALGDPNDDGRSEILLALEKDGGSTGTTSHPFIIGYRGGKYRELWGGSPVHALLAEVELGDLDGDGVEELAAIEWPENDPRRFLTVWRWHGWGFSLVWRSEPGDYRHLVILPPAGGEPARLSVAGVP